MIYAFKLINSQCTDDDDWYSLVVLTTIRSPTDRPRALQIWKKRQELRWIAILQLFNDFHLQMDILHLQHQTNGQWIAVVPIFRWFMAILGNFLINYCENEKNIILTAITAMNLIQFDSSILVQRNLLMKPEIWNSKLRENFRCLIFQSICPLTTLLFKIIILDLTLYHLF